jgi:hypothetical protein
VGYFYFDESIHERGSFILGAFVYSKTDLSKPVADAIASVGLKPGTDEFKSSGRDADQDRRFALRHLLRMEMMDARLGIVLTDYSERGWLGDEAIRGLQWLINVNELGRGHEVYFDQGVSFSRRSVDVLQFEGSTGSVCHLEKDSRLVGGLQVADLAAHSLATMVLETMGLVSKQVPAGPYLGYNEDDHPDTGRQHWLRAVGDYTSQPLPPPRLHGRVIRQRRGNDSRYRELCSAPLRTVSRARPTRGHVQIWTNLPWVHLLAENHLRWC